MNDVTPLRPGPRAVHAVPAARVTIQATPPVFERDEVYDVENDGGLCVPDFPAENTLQDKAILAGLLGVALVIVVLCGMGLHDLVVIAVRHWRGAEQLGFVVFGVLLAFVCMVAVDRIDRRRGR